jgi:hypothetical protein
LRRECASVPLGAGARTDFKTGPHSSSGVAVRWRSAAIATYCGLSGPVMILDGSTKTVLSLTSTDH